MCLGIEIVVPQLVADRWYAQTGCVVAVVEFGEVICKHEAAGILSSAPLMLYHLVWN